MMTEDKIRLCLVAHLKGMDDRKGWITPLGLLLSVLITLATASFRDALGTDSATWDALFRIAAFIFGVWLIGSVVRAVRSKSLDDVVDMIKKGSYLVSPKATVR